MARMFLEKVRSQGLAHLSYIVGHKDAAAVIDPRRDCELYVEKARSYGAKITHIFETHRNEDYAIGSLDLARRTGAGIYHGARLGFEYGNAVAEGDAYEINDVRFEILETPGHTFESITLVVSDAGFSRDPIAVFTGDALFVGDVGRTDLLPEAEEAAALLYESVFEKILPLGDGVLLFPAHGAGSVCGKGLAPREFSTLGYERANSAVLQKARGEFIEFKINEHHYVPPYFKRMEKYNLEGAPPMDFLPDPPPLSPEELKRSADEGAVVVDVRSAEAFAACAVPGSFAIPADMLAAFAGWYIPYERPIALVVEDPGQVDAVVRRLVRMGYDEFAGYMTGIERWAVAMADFQHIGIVTPRELVEMMSGGADFTLLDARTADEYAGKRLRGAVNIYVGEVPRRFGEISKEKPVVTVCSSGQRALVAASALKREGFDVRNSFGSMAACAKAGCPIAQEKPAG